MLAKDASREGGTDSGAFQELDVGGLLLGAEREVSPDATQQTPSHFKPGYIPAQHLKLSKMSQEGERETCAMCQFLY